MKTVGVIVIFALLAAPHCLGVKYEYDSLHRLSKVTYDSGMQVVYSYDEVGNRTSRISTLAADSNVDGMVDVVDLSILADLWMYSDCSESAWCERADIDGSGSVDLADFAVLAKHWLKSLEH